MMLLSTILTRLPQPTSLNASSECIKMIAEKATEPPLFKTEIILRCFKVFSL